MGHQPAAICEAAHLLQAPPRNGSIRVAFTAVSRSRILQRAGLAEQGLRVWRRASPRLHGVRAPRVALSFSTAVSVHVNSAQHGMDREKVKTQPDGDRRSGRHERHGSCHDTVGHHRQAPSQIPGTTRTEDGGRASDTSFSRSFQDTYQIPMNRTTYFVYSMYYIPQTPCDR